MFVMFENAIRVLIVDDHEIVRKSLVAMLAQEPDIEIVGTAANGFEAVELAQAIMPDVIVMDVSMPELDGIRAAGRIKALGLDSMIIMLSMHHNSALVQQARKNGASAYIIKQQANNELVPAIRQARGGSHFLADS
jgi:DNA-binding NarL/FixJ family response regulator